MKGLSQLHDLSGYAAIGANGAAGLAALAAWQWSRLRGRWLWIVTIVAEATMMVPVISGVILESSDRYEAERFHMFYGFVAFLTIGLAYQYRDALRDRVEMFYGLVGLFIMGLGIRAVFEVTG